jgi:hypothetical protein
MSERIYIVRNRMQRLLSEEEKLAKALRGELPPKKFVLLERSFRPQKRNWIDFYFEYFMTFHVNSLRTKNKLWCDGAKVEKLRRAKNRYWLKGFLYLLPEDEDAPNAFRYVDYSTGPYSFGGYVQLAANKDKVLDYRFRIQLKSIQLSCTRKFNQYRHAMQNNARLL